MNRVAQLGSFLSQLAFYMPWIETVVKILTFGAVEVGKDRVDALKEVYAYAGELVKEHETTWVKNQPRDVADSYLDRIDDATDSSSSFHKSSKNRI